MRSSLKLAVSRSVTCFLLMSGMTFCSLFNDCYHDLFAFMGPAVATPAATKGARKGLWRHKPPQTGVATAVRACFPDPAAFHVALWYRRLSRPVSQTQIQTHAPSLRLGVCRLSLLICFC